MSTTTDRLQTAAFPKDYADILIETLAVTPANFLSVKDALHHFRQLGYAQAGEVMQHIAQRIDSATDTLIRKLLQQQRQVAVIWGCEDVKSVRADLTDDQCFDVLEQCRDQHDCQYGFTWTFIEDVAQDLFGDAPETDAADEA
jgi:hypothetical protein